jgi:ribonuclease HII
MSGQVGQTGQPGGAGAGGIGIGSGLGFGVGLYPPAFRAFCKSCSRDNSVCPGIAGACTEESIIFLRAGETITVAWSSGFSEFSGFSKRSVTLAPISKPTAIRTSSKSDSISVLITKCQGKMKRTWFNDEQVEVGLDEAGRGSLWGRLYVGAVIMSPEDEAYFDNGVTLRLITDSKKLTPRRRAVLNDFIRENAIEAVVAYAEPAEVDALNVLQADMAAMHRALKSMETPFQRILVDGDYWKPWSVDGEIVPAYTIPGGDAKSLTIAAASILAKEAHDAWVRGQIEADPTLDEKWGLGSNMGYGTATHMTGLKSWGAHTLHRRSFAPVAAVAVASSNAIMPKGKLKPLFKSGV